MGTELIKIKTKPTKAILAGIGGTLTALTTALATAQLVLADDAVDMGEYSLIAVALVTLCTTVYGVWKVTNKPVEPGEEVSRTATYRAQ